MRLSLAYSKWTTFCKHTCIGTTSLVTFVSEGTIIVNRAFRRCLNLNTLTLSISDFPFRTYTRYTPDLCRCSRNNTSLRIGARVTDNTRVLTSFSHASKFKRTISVKATIRFIGNHSWKNKRHAIPSQISQSYKLLNTYVQHKRHSRLLSWDAYRYRSPYGLWQNSRHLLHIFLDCREVDILCE